MKDLKWHYLSIYYDRRNWNILLENIFKFRQKTEEKYSCFLIFFSEEKGANIKLAITVPDTNSEFINQTYNYFDEFVFKNLSIRKNEFPYGKSLWANYDNNVVVRDIYRLYYFTKDEIEYVNKTFEIILKLSESDLSIDSFYSISLYLLINILIRIDNSQRNESIKNVIDKLSINFSQYGNDNLLDEIYVKKYQINLNEILNIMDEYANENMADKPYQLLEWLDSTFSKINSDYSLFDISTTIFEILGLSSTQRMFIFRLISKWNFIHCSLA